MSFRDICMLLSLIAALIAPAWAKPPAQPRPDLADRAAGHYSGAITSDARGASQDDVNITVTKVGPNRIKVACSCQRIPVRTFHLERAMNTIQSTDGNEVFVLDLSKSPNELNLTIDDAAWFGSRAPSPAGMNTDDQGTHDQGTGDPGTDDMTTAGAGPVEPAASAGNGGKTVTALSANGVYPQNDGKSEEICTMNPGDTGKLLGTKAGQANWVHVGDISGDCARKSGWLWNDGELKVE